MTHILEYIRAREAKIEEGLVLYVIGYYYLHDVNANTEPRYCVS